METFIKKSLQDMTDFIPAEVRPSVDEETNENVSHVTNPRITKWKEHCVTSPFNASVLEWQYNNWYPTEDDVLIATFPKTGTTWMTEIVKNIIYRDDLEMKKVAKAVTQVACYLEMGSSLTFEIMEKLPWKRRIYATHVPSTLVNMERLKKRGCKVIYTMRNPKDQLVSWYNMVSRLPFYKGEDVLEYFPSDWNSFVETMVSGKQPLCDKEGEWYPDHILSWLSYRDDDNVLFVMYEDLKKDLCKELRRIAEFLGVARSDDEIAEIAEEVSFKSMKEKAGAVHKSINFYRKGEVGDWKNYFTVAQSELMDEKMAEKLSDTDIQFVYEL